jgi:hypothetical protein
MDTTSPFLVLTLAALGACAASAPPDTLPRLRDAIQTEVRSPAQNAEHSRLAKLASANKLLHGLTREEVEERLGKGELCTQHPVCHERGFYQNDLYYEVGKPGTYVRYRPSLIVGFDDWGKVGRTFVLEVR